MENNRMTLWSEGWARYTFDRMCVFIWDNWQTHPFICGLTSDSPKNPRNTMHFINNWILIGKVALMTAKKVNFLLKKKLPLFLFIHSDVDLILLLNFCFFFWQFFFSLLQREGTSRRRIQRRENLFKEISDNNTSKEWRQPSPANRNDIAVF